MLDERVVVPRLAEEDLRPLGDVDPGVPVSGAVTLMPGSSMEYAPEGSGFSVVMDVGWSALVLGLLVLVVVARPWRYLTARQRQRQDRHVASLG